MNAVAMIGSSSFEAELIKINWIVAGFSSPISSANWLEDLEQHRMLLEK